MARLVIDFDAVCLNDPGDTDDGDGGIIKGRAIDAGNSGSIVGDIFPGLIDYVTRHFQAGDEIWVISKRFEHGEPHSLILDWLKGKAPPGQVRRRLDDIVFATKEPPGVHWFLGGIDYADRDGWFERQP